MDDPVALIAAPAAAAAKAGTAAFGDVSMGAGVVLIALLAAGTIVLVGPRARALAMAGALVLTPVLLVAEIWNSEQLAPVRDRPLAAFVALGVGVAGLALVAWLFFARRPGALAVAAVAALPFRIPVEAGGSSSNLLVPLYLVVAAGGIAFIARRLWPRAAADGENPVEDRPPPGGLEWLLAGALVLYALQATYSSDTSKALENVVFFYVPFSILFVLLAELRWSPRLLVRCLAVLVALAVVFAGIGFWEYQARELLLNPKVISSNQLESYFRVNSLFFDPNIYGRFLAVVMIAIMATLLWSTRRRDVLIGIALLAFLWGGLVLTFSQSSIGALLVGLGVLGALRWGWGRAAALAAALAAVGAILVLAFPGSLRVDLGSSSSVDRATSGRADLLQGGVELFGNRPFLGYGSGSFSREYIRQERTSTEQATSASHTIPITVAAEQGIVGLGLYLALLWAAFARLFRGATRAGPARAAIAAAFAALVFHTLLYAAFLEDPLTWALLGAGTALALDPAAAWARRTAERAEQGEPGREPGAAAPVRT